MKCFALHFACRELRHNRKIFRLSFFLMVFVSLILALVFSLGDCIAATVREQRFNAYGSFRYYEDSAEGGGAAGSAVQEKIRSVGTLTLLGEELSGGTVGTADLEAVRLGRIVCLEGRLPQNENEAAVEIGALSSMGYAYDLNQELELAVSLFTEDGIVPEPVTKRYTLCGTIQDRSSSWSAKLPSIFLSDSGGKKLLELKNSGGKIQLLKVKLIDADKLNDGELRQTTLQENWAAFPDGGLDQLDSLMMYLILIVCVVCSSLFLTAINASVHRRSATWRTIRQTGGSRRIIIAVIFFEEFLLSLVSLPLGFLLGVFSAWGAVWLASGFLQDQIAFALSLKHMLAAIVLSFVCAAAGASIAGITASRISLLPSGPAKTRKARKRKSRRKIRRIGIKEMLWSRILYHPITALCSILAVCGALVFSALLFEGLSNQTASYRASQRFAHNSDYIFDTSETAGPDQVKLFEKEEANRLQGIYGVDQVYKYRISTANLSASEGKQFTVNLESKRDDYYEWVDFTYRRKSALFQEQMSGLAGIQPDQNAEPREEYKLDPRAVEIGIIGLAGAEEADRFIREAEYQDSVDMDALLEGRSCIIFLPPLYQQPLYTEDSLLGKSAADTSYGFDPQRLLGTTFEILPQGVKESAAEWNLQGKKRRDESAITCGQTLQFSYHGQTISLQVAGILRGFTMENANFPYPQSPYDIITGTKFYHRFSGGMEDESYNFLTVKCSANADYSSTDKQISRVKTELGKGVRFLNFRIEYEETKLNLATGISLSFLFLILYSAMVLVLLSTLSSATIEENRSRIAVYKMLGANDKKVKLSFWLEGFLYWAIASVFALLLLYSIWITEEIQLMGFVYPLRYYLFPTSAFQFQWGSFSFFVILTFVMTEFFSVAPLRRLLKKSPIEQMKT